jgi:fibronectin type 3 domain-containing protein
MKLIGAMFLAAVAMVAGARLEWDPVLDADLAGYKVYVGTNSDQYFRSIDVGNTLQWNIAGLNERTTYYFALTAYDAEPLESAFSDEVFYTTPNLPPSPPGGVRVNTNAFVMKVESSPDLSTWGTVANLMYPTTNAARMYYRLRVEK